MHLGFKNPQAYTDYELNRNVLSYATKEKDLEVNCQLF